MNLTRRTAASLLLAPLCLQGQNDVADPEWSRFVTWVKSVPPGSFGNQREIFPAYQKKVIADGMGAGDAAALMFYQRIAAGLKPGGFVVVEGLGLPVLESLLQAWAKWAPTNLRPLRLEYREGLVDTDKMDRVWSGRGSSYGRLLLQKPI
jgi:hypothetical protein